MTSRITQQIAEAGLQPEDLEANDKDKEFVPPVEEPKNKGGRPKKKYDDLGPKAKKMRYQPILDQVREQAAEDKKSVPQILGKLGEQWANNEVDRPKAAMFKAIAEEKNPLAQKNMPVDKTIALKCQTKRGDRIFDHVRKAVKGAVKIPSAYVHFTCSIRMNSNNIF